MSADTQILITLREYCRALEERAAIFQVTHYERAEDYQRDLERSDALTVELARRQSVLRAWARGEQPVMAALTGSDELDYMAQRQQWNMRHLKHYAFGAANGQLFTNVVATPLAWHASPGVQAALAASQVFTQAQSQPNPFATGKGKGTP